MHEVLKIYSTLENDNYGKLYMITYKCDNDYYFSKVWKSLAPLERQITEVIKHFYSKHRNIALKATPRILKSTSRGRLIRKVQSVF